MQHSLEDDREYLRWNNRRGIPWFIGRGYFWFKQRYLPAVQRVGQANRKEDRFLLSNCYYEIGDIHDFNDCPKAAGLRCNKRVFLTAQYHIARTKRDCDLARKLSRRYPKWPEIVELTEQLTGRKNSVRRA